MIERLSGEEVNAVLLAGTLLLARVVPLVWIAPVLGGRLVPPMVKAAVALALAIVLFPQVGLQIAAQSNAAPVVVAALIIKEAFVGLAIGFVVALVFWAAQSAGRLIDVSRGASLAGSMVPQQRQQSSPLGSLSYQLAVVLFFAIGGHRVLITALAGSYEVIAINAFPATSGLRSFALLCARLSGELILVAVCLAGPVIASILLTDLVLGWINRFAPQINVFFLAMPVKAVLGVGLFALSMSLFLGALPPLMGSALQQVQSVVELLSP